MKPSKYLIIFNSLFGVAMEYGNSLKKIKQYVKKNYNATPAAIFTVKDNKIVQIDGRGKQV